MSEQAPSWVEPLIQSNQQLAVAIAAQAKSLHALAGAIAQLAAGELDDDPVPATYMDGTPR